MKERLDYRVKPVKLQRAAWGEASGLAKQGVVHFKGSERAEYFPVTIHKMEDGLQESQADLQPWSVNP